MQRKTALVTGSSKGIGRSIAITLAENGYDVAINYYSSEEDAKDVCKEIEKRGAKALGIKADVRNLEDINSMFDSFFKEFGSIDLLVNNAGITKYKPFLEVTEDLWNQITNTDWKGAYFCTQRAAQNMVEKGTEGVVINISSNHQEINFPYASIYGPAKAALEKFTKHAALELAEYGIRVNSIAPGAIKNDKENGFTERQKMFISRIPQKRMGTNEEIAEAVVFLASHKARYITGTSLYVDGGARLPAVLDNTFVNN